MPAAMASSSTTPNDSPPSEGAHSTSAPRSRDGQLLVADAPEPLDSAVVAVAGPQLRRLRAPPTRPRRPGPPAASPPPRAAGPGPCGARGGPRTGSSAGRWECGVALAKRSTSTPLNSSSQRPPIVAAASVRASRDTATRTRQLGRAPAQQRAKVAVAGAGAGGVEGADQRRVLDQQRGGRRRRRERLVQVDDVERLVPQGADRAELGGQVRCQRGDRAVGLDRDRVAERDHRRVGRGAVARAENPHVVARPPAASVTSPGPGPARHRERSGCRHRPARSAFLATLAARRAGLGPPTGSAGPRRRSGSAPGQCGAVRRPVRLHEVPLLGRRPDQPLEARAARSWVTRATSSRRRPCRAVSSGGRTTPFTPSRPGRKYTAVGSRWRAGAQRERGRPGGKRGASRRRTTPRCRCPPRSRSASRQTTSLRRSAAQHLAGRVGAERHDRHARASGGTRRTTRTARGAASGSTTAVTGTRCTSVSQKAAHSQPPRCGSARMTPRPAGPGRLDVLVADHVVAPCDLRDRASGQAERLEVVAGVGLEGGLDGPLERRAPKLPTADAAQVADDDAPAAPPGRRRRRLAETRPTSAAPQPASAAAPRAQGLGSAARRGRAEAERGDDRVRWQIRGQVRGRRRLGRARRARPCREPALAAGPERAAGAPVVTGAGCGPVGLVPDLHEALHGGEDA